jgi:hypothetical protein
VTGEGEGQTFFFVSGVDKQKKVNLTVRGDEKNCKGVSFVALEERLFPLNTKYKGRG